MKIASGDCLPPPSPARAVSGAIGRGLYRMREDRQERGLWLGRDGVGEGHGAHRRIDELCVSSEEGPAE